MISSSAFISASFESVWSVLMKDTSWLISPISTPDIFSTHFLYSSPVIKVNMLNLSTVIVNLCPMILNCEWTFSYKQNSIENNF